MGAGVGTVGVAVVGVFVVGERVVGFLVGTLVVGDAVVGFLVGMRVPVIQAQTTRAAEPQVTPPESIHKELVADALPLRPLGVGELTVQETHVSALTDPSEFDPLHQETAEENTPAVCKLFVIVPEARIVEKIPMGVPVGPITGAVDGMP